MSLPDGDRHRPPASVDNGRRLMLRISIKLLVLIGLAFLLVPFILSLPWPRTGIPPDATQVDITTFTPGETREIILHDGSTALVTRSTPALALQLRDFPEDLLWYPSAPGLAGQPWFVVSARNTTNMPVHFLPPHARWPGGLVDGSGAAWDVAGRSLKPWPGHPTGYAMTAQNLLPLTWSESGGLLILVPAPAATPP